MISLSVFLNLVSFLKDVHYQSTSSRARLQSYAAVMELRKGKAAVMRGREDGQRSDGRIRSIPCMQTK
jgi:hypothetical protein